MFILTNEPTQEYSATVRERKVSLSSHVSDKRQVAVNIGKFIPDASVVSQCGTSNDNNWFFFGRHLDRNSKQNYHNTQFNIGIHAA